jgi:nitroreductase
VCPEEAISCPDCPVEDVSPCEDLLPDLPQDAILNIIKCRRSVRHYKKDKVEAEKIIRIIEAGRFTPTGSNRQPLSYIVLEKELEEIKLLCMKGLREFTLTNPDNPAIGRKSIKNRFLNMHEEYIKTGRDRLFFNAPQVIVIVADKSLGGRPEVDGGMAASNMGFEAFVQNLGYCFIGFFVTATEVVPKLRERLGLNENDQVVACMTIGYPDVKYFRIVSRKPARIKYL